MRDLRVLAAIKNRAETTTIAGLLAEAADPNQADEMGKTPLFVAARLGRLDVIEALLAAGAATSLNQETIWGATPLLAAVHSGSLAVVARLLDTEAILSLNRANNEGLTPLLAAVIGGHLTIVTKLLIAGARVDQVDTGGDTPLSLAIRHENLAIARELIFRGANVTTALRLRRGTAMSVAMLAAINQAILDFRYSRRNPAVLASAASFFSFDATDSSAAGGTANPVAALPAAPAPGSA